MSTENATTDSNQRTVVTKPVDNDLSKAIKKIGFWWHSIDLNGIITPGGKNADLLNKEWECMDVPNLEGKTVLDIGAWDGYFSFQAERHGAKHVVALDHFVWAIDREGWAEYHKRCEKVARPPDPIENTKYWDPIGLPGKRGFDLACTVLASKVKAVNRDYMLVSREEIGTFDVVLYLGVLYHMQNPFDALKKVAELTRGVAIIETHAVEIYGHNSPLAEFYPESQLNGDPTNYWGLNLPALVGMCRAAGFRRISVKKGPPRYSALRTVSKSFAALLGIPWGRRHRHYRAIIHAWK